ncbi:MAG: lytic transglycosylase domain-containing protein [Thermoanaerobaculia bacterium]|nr:MAG: lytic transglycosylase domain-containing protein [Thermoanaerobaculia bacterium]
MTPASARRLSLRVPATAALVFLTLGFGGPGLSKSDPVSARVLPLELGRIFPELRWVPVPEAVPAPRPAPATLAAPQNEELRRAADRYLQSLPFGPQIGAAARAHRVDGLLIASVVEAESSFRPDAVSPSGALGLMQLMPFHLDGVETPLDPVTNLNLGTRYLAGLERRFGGDLELALAAYHAGPGAVERWGGVPPYTSTQLYVDRVLDRYREHRVSLEQQVSAAGRSGPAQGAQRGS